MTQTLTSGLRFRTTRGSFWWRLPDGSRFQPPPGTTGQIRVRGKEVSFRFDGLEYPLGGPAPTIRKPKAGLPDWMEVIE